MLRVRLLWVMSSAAVLVLGALAIGIWRTYYAPSFMAVFALQVAWALGVVCLVLLVRSLLRKKAPSVKTVQMRASSIPGDEPTDLRVRDDFGRLPFVHHVEITIRKIGVNSPSSVIGLAGSWGAGKSSVLKTLVAVMRESGGSQEPWLVASLNPWRYPTGDALVAGFFSELREALPDDARWSQARTSIAALVRSAAPFGSIASVVGFDASKSLEAIAHQLDVRGGASKVQEDAERALLQSGRPILVVIDDLDRLEPAELLYLFRLVRLVGRLPNVHYLLAYDEATLSGVLKATSLVSNRARARAYLEKIVQVRIDLPPVRSSTTEKVVDESIERIASELGIELTDARSADFAMTYHQYIARTLQTPRTIRRWLVHVELLFPTLVGEADFVDFSCIVWLSLQYPGVPQMLQEHRADIFTSRSPTRLFDKFEPEEMHQSWRKWISGAGVQSAEVEKAFGALARLFPTIDQAFRKSTNSPDLESARLRFGVGHPDYFDRYFNLGVPEDELSESAFLADMDSIIGDRTAHTRLEDFLHLDARAVIPRIEGWVDANPEAKGTVFLWLAENQDQTSDDGLFSGRSAVRGVLFRLLAGESSEAIRNYLEPLWSDTRYVASGARVIADLLREANSQEEIEPLIPETVRKIRGRLREIEGPAHDRSAEFKQLLWLWQTLDNGSLRTWYRGRVTRAGWSLLDAMALLVESATPVGVRNPVSRLNGLPSANLEAFLGLSWLTSRLRKEDPIWPMKSIEGSHRPEDTWENRLAIAAETARGLVNS